MLFGVSFGEEIKKASVMEKFSKDIVKTSLVFKRVLQLIKQLNQVAPSKKGNSRIPASTRSAMEGRGVKQ